MAMISVLSIKGNGQRQREMKRIQLPVDSEGTIPHAKDEIWLSPSVATASKRVRF